MKDYLPRIAGGALLASAFILLLLAPPRGHFSVANFYAFLACVACGFLLITGFIGTHPVAARLRRETRLAGTPRPGPPCQVSERSFVCLHRSFGQILLTVLCVVMGLSLLALGVFLARVLPLSALDRKLVGLPLWISGALCIWCPLRVLRMYVKVDMEGISARLYFRTVKVRWEDVVALIAREHYFLMLGSLGIIYSVYSTQTKLSFTYRLPERQQLTSIIAQATGLRWQ